MPLSMMTFLYGFMIIIGIIFIACGVLQRPLKGEPSPEAHGRDFSSDLSSPTGELLPLGFMDDLGVLEDRAARKVSLNPTVSASPGHAWTGSLSRIFEPLRGILKTPRLLSRQGRNLENIERVEEPSVTTIVLGAEKSRTTEKSTDDM